MFDDDRGEDLYLRVYQSNNVHLSDLMPVLSNLRHPDLRDSQGTGTCESRGREPSRSTRSACSRETANACTTHARSDLRGDLTACSTGLWHDDHDECDGASWQGLSWRQVDMIRSYARYIRQVPGATCPTSAAFVQILLEHPEPCEARWSDLFEAPIRPRPRRDRSPPKRVQQVTAG